MIADLAGRFADEHPVVTTIHRLEMWAFRARGIADPEPPPTEDDDRRD